MKVCKTFIRRFDPDPRLQSILSLKSSTTYRIGVSGVRLVYDNRNVLALDRRNLNPDRRGWKSRVPCQACEGIRYLHEAAFSINLAWTLVAFVFLFDLGPITRPLFGMDRAIYRYRHPLPPGVKFVKDTWTEGYFAFFVPAVALGVCLWLLLRLFSRTGFARETLRTVAGVAALLGPPIWWLSFTYTDEHRYGWSPFTAIQFYEVALVLVFAIIYRSRIQPNSGWVLIPVLVHYGFWFWQFGPYHYFMGYGGPVAPATGLCASLTWYFTCGN
jgi:hypothetical protein